jgi:prepilin-type N-terminal cleavage/methylation domain-containing protein
MRQKGFTLIELMVVLTVTAVLGILGIAGFTTYNQIQILQSASSDVVTILNLAKSRAQSQVKISALCGSSETLNGYKVEILAPKNYTLHLRCSGVDRQVSEETKILPNDLSFNISTSFFFPIQMGGVQASGQIVISGFGRSKTVIVNSLGGVSIQ